MRCPICSSELREGATTCDECGCGILPPPPTGVEPTAFAREDSAPRWPLILSIIGVVAALGVIAVALFPVFKDDDTSVATATTGSTSTVSADTTILAVTTSVEPSTSAAATTTVDPAVSSGAGSTETTAIGSSTTQPATTQPVATQPSTTQPVATLPRPTTTTAAPSTTVAATTPTSGSGQLPIPAAVTKVEATCTAPDSTDSQGNPISFVAGNVVDGNADTAWRCAGDSKRQALVLTLDKPTDIGFVGGIPGWLSKDPYLGLDRWTQNRQVVVGRWGCLDAGGQQTASVEQLFDDRRAQQYMPVDGFTACSKVVFEIVESSSPGARDYTAISELGTLVA